MVSHINWKCRMHLQTQCAVAFAMLILCLGATWAGAEQLYPLMTPEEAARYLPTSEIPAEEKDMSYVALLEALKEDKKPWVTDALYLRAHTCSRAELEAMAQEYRTFGETFGTEQNGRLFASYAADVFPRDISVPLMADLLLSEPIDVLKASMFVLAVSYMRPPHPPGLEEELTEILQGIYTQFDSEHNPGDPAGELCWHVIQAWGSSCGEHGLDKLLEVAASERCGDTVLCAIADVGTERAIQFLVDYYQKAERPYDKLEAVQALVRAGYETHPADLQARIRADLDGFLVDPDQGYRIRAARIAGSTTDPYFLPILEDIEKNDPYCRDHNGTPWYDVRRAATEGKGLILLSDKTFARRMNLAKDIADLEKQLAQAEKALAAEPDDTGAKAHRDYLQEGLEKLRAEEAELGPPLKPQSIREILGYTSPAQTQ